MLIIDKKTLLNWFKLASEILNEKESYLTELDAPIGDADHGRNIAKGFRTVIEMHEVNVPFDIKGLLRNAGMILMSKVGGASGMLYSNLFLQMSKKIDPGINKVQVNDFIQLFEAGVQGIIGGVRASVGDKTMIDVWVPFIETWKKNSAMKLTEIMNLLIKEAKVNVRKTIPLIAKKGRASYLGERSRGHQDPGATSSYYIILGLRKAIYAAAA